MRKHNMKRRIATDLKRRTESEFSLKNILQTEADNYRREIKTNLAFHRNATFITSNSSRNRTRRTSTLKV